VTAESGEILALEDVKRYLRIPTNVQDEDEDVLEMLVAAREDAEAITHRTLRASVTRTETLSSWFKRFNFLNPPLHTTPAVVVNYYDTDNAQQTVAASNYNIVPVQTTGDQYDGVTYLQFNDLFVRPIPYQFRPDPITITYVTGYVTQALIPAVAKQAVKLLLWELYYKDTKDDAFGVNVGLGRKRAEQLLGSKAFGFYA
jgi:hypothetical protein